MSSFIYYRFKSSKDARRVTFDGTGITVFDIKREIIRANDLAATADSFNLELVNPDTHEVYEDDAEVLPRSSSVEVRRVPVRQNQSRHSAARYVSGGSVAQISVKNAARREDMAKPGAAAESTPLALAMPSAGMKEEDMVDMMFAAQGEEWSRTQQEMASKTPVYYSRRPTKPQNGVDATVPQGYVCHRCGQRGHWIQNCPTLDNPNFEAKRIRRTTGIPKSMLRAIEAPTDEEKGTYMMNAEGEYVVAVADDRAWQEFQRRQKLQEEAARRAVPVELQDPVTHELMVDPRRMPCCGKVYSEATIQDLLIASDFTCPNCGQKEVYLDQLEVDDELAAKIEAFTGKTDKTKSDSQKEVAEEPVEEVKMAESESDDDYDPTQGLSLKRRRSSVSSASSIGSVGDSAEPETAEKQSTEPANPIAMPFFPFVFPPFFMPFMHAQAGNGNDAANDQKYRRRRGRPVRNAEAEMVTS